MWMRILSGNLADDTTPPTVFLPQRHPWNPGGTNFGVQYGYKVTVATNSDFWVWTYAYDVSGITNVSLLWRENGTNPPVADQFKTYAGGPLTGAWRASNMTQRVTAPVIGVTPQYIADYYYTKVTGISNAFVDYYVTATDARGNTYKSPIQHVYVGAGTGSSGGSSGGGGGPVTVLPDPPVAGNSVTIQYVATGRVIASANPVYLHLGWNGWNPVVSPDPAMTFNSASNAWQYTVPVPASATALNCVFNNGSGTWDNNNGANWNFSVSANNGSQPPSPPQNLIAVPVQTNRIDLSWSASSGASGYQLSRDNSPLAATTATAFSDIGLAANSSHCYSVIASNSAGFSAASATVCASTPSNAPLVLPGFVMNGAFDSAGYRLASNSLVLDAAVRGTTLYVATGSTGHRRRERLFHLCQRPAAAGRDRCRAVGEGGVRGRERQQAVSGQRKPERLPELVCRQRGRRVAVRKIRHRFRRARRHARPRRRVRRGADEPLPLRRRLSDRRRRRARGAMPRRLRPEP